MATIVLDQPFNLTHPTNWLFRNFDDDTGYADHAGGIRLVPKAGDY